MIISVLCNLTIGGRKGRSIMCSGVHKMCMHTMTKNDLKVICRYTESSGLSHYTDQQYNLTSIKGIIITVWNQNKPVW